MIKTTFPYLEKHEWLSLFVVFYALSATVAFCRGQTGYAFYDFAIYGAQARTGILLSVIMFKWLLWNELQKIYRKIYRVFACIIVFMILMFLGYHFISWWNIRIAIPLTLLWFPAHLKILEGLPRKESDTGI